MEDIEKVLENFELKSSLRGVVEDCREEYVRILFSEEKQPQQEVYSPRQKFAWQFDYEKAKTAGADFEGAKVQYDVYVNGPYTVAVLKNIGSPIEELPKGPLITLTTEELKELSR